MTQLPPRPAMPDAIEEELLAMLREEIRLARMQGGGRVQAEFVVEGQRVTRESYVQARRRPMERA